MLDLLCLTLMQGSIHPLTTQNIVTGFEAYVHGRPGRAVKRILVFYPDIYVQIHY